MAAKNKKIEKELSKCSLPIVTIGEIYKSDMVTTNIDVDHYMGGKLSMQYLLSCGCKNIVYMKGTSELVGCESRYKGYKGICTKLSIKEACIECGYTYDEGIKAWKNILDKYPTVDGIIATNDVVAYALYKCLTDEGYRIPEDIQIIGYEDNLDSRLVITSITTISFPMKEIARRAVESIIEYSSESSTPNNTKFEVSLIERKTTKKETSKCIVDTKAM